MTIVLTPETEAKLREKARREGADASFVAESLILAALEAEERDFQEAIIGIQRGLEAGRQGRVRPAADVHADLRAKLQQQSG